MVMCMKIIAHRANDGINKENSEEAILNSLSKEYIDGIEIDIRKTKDKQFVISHGPFHNGNHIKHTKLNKLKLPSLNNVLNRIVSDKIIMIEIKNEDKNYKETSYKLHKIIKKYNLNYYICSFDYNLINYFKNKYPKYKCGLIIGLKINEDKLNNNLDFNSVNTKYMFRNLSKETFIWTVNSKKEFEKINKRYNVITDKGYKLIK